MILNIFKQHRIKEIYYSEEVEEIVVFAAQQNISSDVMSQVLGLPVEEVDEGFEDDRQFFRPIDEPIGKSTLWQLIEVYKIESIQYEPSSDKITVMGAHKVHRQGMSKAFGQSLEEVDEGFEDDRQFFRPTGIAERGRPTGIAKRGRPTGAMTDVNEGYSNEMRRLLETVKPLFK